MLLTFSPATSTDHLVIPTFFILKRIETGDLALRVRIVGKCLRDKAPSRPMMKNLIILKGKLQINVKQYGA